VNETGEHRTHDRIAISQVMPYDSDTFTVLH
jgi:hypothetical protein